MTNDLQTKYHVMLDIETLGTRPGCAVVSIGAAFFTPEGVEVHKVFHELVDVASCIGVGLHMDAATIAWWTKQNTVVCRELFSPPRVPLASACRQFSEWALSYAYNEPLDPEDVVVWSNGANFDAPILHAAFVAAGVEWPFKFYNELCYRTLRRMVPPEVLVYVTHPNGEQLNLFSRLDELRSLPEHCSLGDAVRQADDCYKLMSYALTLGD